MRLNRPYKIRMLVLILAMMAVMLTAACSNSNKESLSSPGAGSSNPAPESSASTTSPQPEGKNPEDFKGEVVWHNVIYPSKPEAYDKFIADFNKVYPNIKIKVVTDDINTLIAASDPPDVTMNGFGYIPMIKNAILEDLTPYMVKDGFELDRLNASTVSLTKYEGGQYGLPLDMMPLFGLTYNKKILNEMGITVIPELHGLDDTGAFLKQFWNLKNGAYETVGQDPFNIYSPYNSLFWASYLNGAVPGDFYNPETHKVTLNHPKIVEALEWLVKFKQDNIDAKALAKFTQSLGTNDAFATEKMPVALYVPDSIAYVRGLNPNLDLGVAATPASAIWAGGYQLSLVKPGDNKEAAWEFIKWAVSTEEGAASLGENLGALSSLNEYAWIQQKADTDLLFKALLDLSKKAEKWIPQIPADILTEFLKQLPSLEAGDITAQQFLDHLTQIGQEQVDAFYK